MQGLLSAAFKIQENTKGTAGVGDVDARSSLLPPAMQMSAVFCANLATKLHAWALLYVAESLTALLGMEIHGWEEYVMQETWKKPCQAHLVWDARIAMLSHRGSSHNLSSNSGCFFNCSFCAEAGTLKIDPSS